MAQEQVSVELLVDTSASQAALDAYTAKLDALAKKQVSIGIAVSADTAIAERGIKALNTELGKSSGLISEQAKEQQKNVTAINAQVEALKRQLPFAVQGSQKFREISKAIELGEKASRDLAKNVQALDKARLDKVQKQLDANAKAAEKFSGSLKDISRDGPKAFSGLGLDTTIGKLTAGGILVEAFKQGLQGIGDVIQQGSAFEQLNLSLEAFTGSTEAGAQAYQSFKDTALKTPFDIPGVAQAGKTLLAFGLNLEQTVKATDQLAIIAGATGSDLNNLARNLGQISAQGRAYTRDLNQFATAGIPIYAELAKVLDVSVIQVRQFAEEGSIGFEEVSKALDNLTASGSGFAQIADKQLTTVAGAVGNLQSSVFEFAGALNEKLGSQAVSALNGLREALNFVVENFDTFKSALIVVGQAILGLKLAGLIEQFKAAGGAAGLLGKAGETLASQLGPLSQALGATLTATSQLITSAGGLKGLVGQLRAGEDQSIATAAALSKFKASLGALVTEVAAAGLKLAAFSLAIQLIAETISKGKPADYFQNLAPEAEKSAAAVKTLNGELLKTSSTAQTAADAVKSIFTQDASSLQKFKDFAGTLEVIRESSKLLGIQYDDLLNKGRALLANKEAESGVLQKQIEFNRTFLEASDQRLAKNKADVASLEAGLAVTRERVAQESNLGGILSGRFKQQFDIATAQEGALKTLQKAVQAEEAKNKALETQTKELEKRVGIEENSVELSKQKLTEAQKDLEVAKEELKNAEKAAEIELDLLKRKKEDQLSGIKEVRDATKAAFDQRIEELQQEKTELESQLDVIREKYDLEIAGLQARGPFEQQLYDLQKKQLQDKIASGKLSGEELLNAQARLERLERQERIQQLQIAKKKEEDALEKKIEETNKKITDQKKEQEEALKFLEEKQRRIEELYRKQVQAINDSIAAIKQSVDNAAGLIEKMSESKAEIDDMNLAAQSFNAILDLSARKAESLRDRLREAAQAYAQANNLPVPQFFAAGGPIAAGQRAIVNEQGKEAFLSASGRLSMINAPSWGQWTAPSKGTIIPAHLTKMLNIPSGGVNLNTPAARGVGGPRGTFTPHGSNSAVSHAMHRISQAQQAQATELGRLSRAVDRMTSKEWNVDVNIHGNNPLLNKLRRTR